MGMIVRCLTVILMVERVKCRCNIKVIQIFMIRNHSVAIFLLDSGSDGEISTYFFLKLL